MVAYLSRFLVFNKIRVLLICSLFFVDRFVMHLLLGTPICIKRPVC